MKMRIWCIALATLMMVRIPGTEARNIPEILPSEDFKKLGIASFAFMKVNTSARVAGMGDAYTAVADDINAVAYNPAGLSHLQGFAYQLSYVRWLVDTAFYSGAVAYNTPYGVIGFSALNYDVGDMEVRTIYNPEGTGEMIRSGALALGIAYAWRATDRLGVGLRMSYVQETLHRDVMKSGVLDIGTHFYTGFRSLRLAMTMRNYGPDTNVLQEDQKYLMPMNFDLGGAMEVFGEQGDSIYLTLSVASSFAVDYAQRYHFGGELWVANTLALRAGYKHNYDAESFSLGAGVRASIGERKVTADISYTRFGDLLNAPIRLTIGGEF